MASLIPTTRPGMVLFFKADQALDIRIIDESPGLAIQRHTYKSGRTFLKALCVGEQECPYCAILNHDKYKNLELAQKPYGLGTEICKAVYVYEHKKFLLISGWDVWQAIERVRVDKGSVLDRDIRVSRTDQGRRVTYHATPGDVSPFTVDISKLSRPNPEEYQEFLGNVQLPLFQVNDAVGMSAPASPQVSEQPAAQPAEQPAAPTSLVPPRNAPAPTPVPTAQAPVQPTAPAPVQPAAPAPAPAPLPTGDRKHSKEKADALNAVVREVGFDSKDMNQSMKRVSPDKKKVTEFTDEEVDKLIVEYQMLRAEAA